MTRRSSSHIARYERENRLFREGGRILWRFEAYLETGGDRDLMAGNTAYVTACYHDLIALRRQGLRERDFDRLILDLTTLAGRHDPRRQRAQGRTFVRTTSSNLVSPQDLDEWRKRMRLDGRGEHYRFRFLGLI